MAEGRRGSRRSAAPECRAAAGQARRVWRNGMAGPFVCAAQSAAWTDSGLPNQKIQIPKHTPTPLADVKEDPAAGRAARTTSQASRCRSGAGPGLPSGHRARTPPGRPTPQGPSSRGRREGGHRTAGDWHHPPDPSRPVGPDSRTRVVWHVRQACPEHKPKKANRRPESFRQDIRRCASSTPCSAVHNYATVTMPV